MKTRSLLRLEPNGTVLDNIIPTNEQPKKNRDGILETVFYKPIFSETNKLPKIKH